MAAGERTPDGRSCARTAEPLPLSIMSSTPPRNSPQWNTRTAFWRWSLPHLRGEVILQLSRRTFRTSGRAGGKPAEFDWDDYALRARLPIPAGKGAGSHVRIGLAIEAPDATAFFDSARVLLIGETNDLTAQFSSDAIAQRSRLRTAPALPVSFKNGKEPLRAVYRIKVPGTAIHGDHADLAIEADGSSDEPCTSATVASREIAFCRSSACAGRARFSPSTFSRYFLGEPAVGSRAHCYNPQ